MGRCEKAAAARGLTTSTYVRAAALNQLNPHQPMSETQRPEGKSNGAGGDKSATENPRTTR